MKQFFTTAALAAFVLASSPVMTQQALAQQALAQQGSAQQDSAGNAEHGKTLYHDVGCYQCHGLAGQGALMTGPRVSHTELPFDAFANQLRHPANQMPPYEAAAISDRDVADIYAYIRQMPPPPDPNSIPLLKTAQ